MSISLLPPLNKKNLDHIRKEHEYYTAEVKGSASALEAVDFNYLLKCIKNLLDQVDFLEEKVIFKILYKIVFKLID